MGWSTALFLRRLGHAGSLTVVERGGEDYSSTARSAGGIRHQFTLPENVQLSMFGTEYLRSLRDTPLAADFVERGYLFLAATQAGEETLKTSNVMQRRLGAHVALMTPAQIASKWPFLRTDDVRLGAFGERGEGWLDSHLLRSSFAQQAKALGAEQLKHTARRALLDGRGRVEALELSDGSRLECDVLVNALGPSAADLMTATVPDFNLPVRRRKRNIFFFDCKSSMPHCPMVIDSSGVYFRPEGSGYIAGCSPEADEADPDVAPGDFSVQEELWEERIWPALAHRAPLFECLKVKSSWAGHYEYNTLDHNGIVGPALADNLYLINGFSGHGLQQSPGAGRALAELVLKGRFESIDLSRFSYRRIAEKQPLFEQNII